MRYTEKCHHCNGTGYEPDYKFLGKFVRKERLKLGISLRKMARQLRVTPTYLCDLEYGRRSWSGPKAQRYLRKLKISREAALNLQ